MSNGAFSKWLKEFCTIVLIQSLQAFLFAIIVILIVSSYNQSKADESSKALGLGIIGVVGLASLSKLEDLVKKMLGVGTEHDPTMKSGANDLATTLIAAKMGGRILNNGSNLAKGLSGYRKGLKEEGKIKQREIKRQQVMYGALEKDDEKGGSGSSGGSGTGGAGAGRTSNSGNATPLNPSKARANGSNYAAITAKARKNNSGTGSGGSGGTGGYAASGGTGGYAASGGSGNSNSSGELDRASMYKEYELREAYNEKIKEAQDKRKDAIATGFKGLTGTGAAIFGGAAGAVVGASTGDVKDTIKGAGAGIGMGDYIGEKSIDVVRGTTEKLKNIKKDSITNNKIINKKLANDVANKRAEVDAMFEKAGFDFGSIEGKKKK